MDDFAYRAQLISQNDCYNQPPHLSCDLIHEYTRQLTIRPEGWDVFYTPYPVSVPEGITAYQVKGVNSTTHSLNLAAIAAGATLPAGASIIVKGTPGKTAAFRPSTKTPVSITGTYLKGDLVSQHLTSTNANMQFYQLQSIGDAGIVAFSPVEAGTLQPGATPWLQVSGAQSDTDLLFLEAEQIPTGIGNTMDNVNGGSTPVYDLTGRRVSNAKYSNNTSHGIYIMDGRKVVK